MIYGDVLVIGIQLELGMVCDTIKCGMFNFVFDGKLFPGQGMGIEFYPTILDLQHSLQFGLKKRMPDIGMLPLEQIDFLDEPPGVIHLSSGMAEDFGFCCCLGFDGNEDRFFYSMDYGKTYQEKRYPQGTIERLINSLPKIEDIDFCSQDVVKDFVGQLSATGFKQTSDWDYSSSNDHQSPLVLSEQWMNDKVKQLENAPPHCQRLFEASRRLPKAILHRYTQDADGHIHRFSPTHTGDYYWSGSTNHCSNPLKLPLDVKASLHKEFGWSIK